MKGFLGAAAVWVAWTIGASGAGEQPKVVYLERSRDFELRAEKRREKGLLARELVRQSLLIAARDELGLLTRDFWLGEPMPDPGNGPPVDLAAHAGDPNRIELIVGPPARSSVKVELKLAARAYYPAMIAVADRLSRGEVPEALRELGFQGKPGAWRQDLAPPAEASRLLEEMNFAAQFFALRQIHATLRSQGESPALLGALVRGYANLGLLTEFHLHPAHKVFKARALLYANRLMERRVRPLWSRYHRAYAYALVGLHQWALRDMEAAGKECLATPAGAAERPSWAGVIDAYCHYRVDRLDRSKVDPCDRQLLGLLDYMAAELSGTTDLPVRTGLVVVGEMPECYRVHDGLCQFGGVSAGHDVTLRWLMLAGPGLYARLAGMPELPESVAAVIRERSGSLLRRLFGGEENLRDEFNHRAMLIEALRAAGRAEPPSAGQGKRDKDAPAPKPCHVDRAEFSWSILGNLARELTLAQMWRRGWFERYMLSVPTEPFLAASAPLAATHPYRAFVECLASDPSTRSRARERLSRVEPQSLECHGYRMWDELYQSHPGRRDQWWQQASEQADDLVRDMDVWITVQYRRRLPFARKLIEASPNNPRARAVFIDDDWKKIASRAVAWEKDEQPAVLAALGNRYLALGRWADARRCLEAAIRAVPAWETYQALATLHEKQGHETEWLATLEEFLRQPDYGLSHGLVRQRIAIRYMAHGQWEKALPYATAAAQTNSEWAVATLGCCYEGLQNWPEAERCFKNISHRYDDARPAWYSFCRRTGHGDLAAARELARRWADGPHEKDHAREELREVSRFYMLENDLKKALAGFRECFAVSKGPAMGLHVALIADELKDVKTRDEALKQILALAPDEKSLAAGALRPELIRLARWMVKDLAAGGRATIDPAGADHLFGAATADQKRPVRYFLGKYLDLHGRSDDAIKLWKECVAYRVVDGTRMISEQLRTMSAANLLRHGVRPEHYKELLRAPNPGDEPTASKPK